MKPRKEWFSLLPPDVEKMALENTDAPSLLDKKVKSMYEAIGFAFTWVSSKQGHKFWEKIANDEKYKN
jgi:hypothetical protein